MAVRPDLAGSGHHMPGRSGPRTPGALVHRPQSDRILDTGSTPKTDRENACDDETNPGPGDRGRVAGRRPHDGLRGTRQRLDEAHDQRPQSV